MNAEFFEVTNHNPSRLLIDREIPAIPPRLLVWREERAI